MSTSCCITPQGHDHFELDVVGAGSAGISAAPPPADQGATVALIGHGNIGGTCVNVGCVPSKSLIRAMEAAFHANRASRFAGLSASAEIVDWRKMRKQKDDLVSLLRQTKYVDLLPAYNSISYIEGKARLGNGGVTVNGRHIGAGRVILATGSHEHVPDIPGLEDVPYLTSTTAFELSSLPKSMLIIGGGFVGCELAQIFSRAGVEVRVLHRTRLLPQMEPEISSALAGYLREEGIAVQRVGSYDGIQVNKNGIALAVTIDGAVEKFEAEQVLLAAGRKANTGDLGLEMAGVELRSNGGIKVDDRMRTTKSGVYAAGDVTGNDQFVYMAAYGAKIAANNALNGDGQRYDNLGMPAIVFTDPQVASVGLTEAAAAAEGIKTRTSVISLENVPRALVARDTRGLIKLVAAAATGRLIGAHILAPEGADSIQTASLAIRQGMTYTQLGDMIFPYLTTAERLKLAAQAFDQDVSKLSCCAG